MLKELEEEIESMKMEEKNSTATLEISDKKIRLLKAENQCAMRILEDSVQQSLHKKNAKKY